MKWPFPNAETVPSLNKFEQGTTVSSESYAVGDRIFAKHFNQDKVLQAAFKRLLEEESEMEAEMSEQMISSKLAIIRAFIMRAGFATEQKFLWILEWEKATEKLDKQQLRDDANAVDEEVRNTLKIIKPFENVCSPHLSLVINTLESLASMEPLNERYPFFDVVPGDCSDDE